MIKGFDSSLKHDELRCCLHGSLKTTGCSLSYLGFFLIDAVIITTLSFAMARCRPATLLSTTRPTDSLLSLATVASIGGAYPLATSLSTLARIHDWHCLENFPVVLHR
jgi:hypothetical protein